MKRSEPLLKLHPLTSFVVFFAIIMGALAFANPLFCAVSFAGAFLLSAHFRFLQTLKFLLVFALPAAVMFALFNAAFYHGGTTILFYVDYTPITAESILAGLFGALIIINASLWFFCVSHILLAERVIYLAGGLMPKTALITSLSLRLIPSLVRRSNQIHIARRAMGEGKGALRNGLATVFILISWSLDSCFETAQSLFSRGLDLQNKTRLKRFRFSCADLLLILLALALVVYVAFGAFDYSFYPVFFVSFDYSVIPPLACYMLLCFLPRILSVRL